MTWSRSSQRLLAACAGLIVATNAVLLVGVAYNRSGEPESALRLTERELNIVDESWFENENDVVELRLIWRVAHRGDSGLPDFSNSLDWLSEEDLRSLGFDVSRSPASEDAVRYYDRLLPKSALLVLEYDGPAYQAVLEESRQRLKSERELAAANSGKDEFARRVQWAERELDREERAASRLFVVDAGQDLATLRARYPDRGRYAIVRGRLQLTLHRAPGRLSAYVTAIDVGTVSVPSGDRSVIPPLVRSIDVHGPRFEATVNFGRRLEPWISGLSSSRPVRDSSGTADPL